jgi:hypothetical protein
MTPQPLSTQQSTLADKALLLKILPATDCSA